MDEKSGENVKYSPKIPEIIYKNISL